MKRNVMSVALISLSVVVIGLIILHSFRSNKRINEATSVFEALKTGDYQAATKYFEPSLRVKLTPQKLSQAWQQLIAKNGPFKDITVTRASTKAGTTAYCVWFTCKFEKGNKWGAIVFDRRRERRRINLFALCDTPLEVQDITNQIKWH